MTDDEGLITKWWNGEWQYRLRLVHTDDHREGFHVLIEHRGPGGSWGIVWSQYDSGQTPGIEPDEDLDQ